MSAILVVVDMDGCSEDTGLRKAWQWELGAFTLTVTWLNLLSLLRSQSLGVKFAFISPFSGKSPSLAFML